MCYIDKVYTKFGLSYFVNTGRPCDPNSITWEYKHFKDAAEMASSLLGRGTVTHTFYQDFWEK